MEPREEKFAIEGIVTVPMEKGDGAYSRPIEGWATTYGVLDENGRIIPTVDRQGEIMYAASRPGLMDFSQYVKRGFINYKHKTVLIGIPHEARFVGPEDELAHAQGKVGYWNAGHLIDRHDDRTWLSPDGSIRYRMTKRGEVTDEPWIPTPEELDLADHLWELGRKLQKTGRTLGFSIQGRKTKIKNGKDKARIVYATVHQCAILPYPHNYDATIEVMGKGMGESPDVLALARALLMPLRRGRYRLTEDEAITAAREILKRRGVLL